MAGNMFQLFLISIFFSPSWGIAGDCTQTHFVDKSHDAYPKPGAYCTSPEPGDRWRGELIYEYLEDSSGIRVKWRHILQRPDCLTVLVNFFVDNVFFKVVSPFRHRNDWVEIRAEKTFELKIQAHYRSHPKCFAASRLIQMVKTESTSIVTLFEEETTEGHENNNSTLPASNFFTEDNYKNTIILCLSSLLLITIIVLTVIAIVKWRKIREGIMKVDDNRDVYGTYYGGEV